MLALFLNLTAKHLVVATCWALVVVVFPTPYEGGNLVLRHEGKGWISNASQILSNATKSSVAFVALYSDIEHEVDVVTPGYRVTLTFNLYRDDNLDRHPSIIGHYEKQGSENALRAQLASLLQGRTQVLPSGGYLGFGLSERYPFERNKINLTKELLGKLKGSDAVLQKVCHELGLDTTIQVVFDDTYSDGMIPYPPSFSDSGTFSDDLDDMGSLSKRCHCHRHTQESGRTGGLQEKTRSVRN